VIENAAVRQAMYHFLLVRHCDYISILYTVQSPIGVVCVTVWLCSSYLCFQVVLQSTCVQLMYL